MYRGFNVNLDEDFESYYEEGRRLYESDKARVQKKLASFILNNGALDGTAMQNSWFPQFGADIFISHSHNDEKKAIALAGFLHHHFELRSFIDSCIWGYADELLKIIDNEYCKRENSTNYDYQKRNYSTSHVHTMLSAAINMMIDSTECLFFLNTPSSISTSDVIDKTESPWIYSEITMSQTLRRNVPERIKNKEEYKAFFKSEMNETFHFEYELDLRHLSEINFIKLLAWAIRGLLAKKEGALDELYEMVSPEIIIK